MKRYANHDGPVLQAAERQLVLAHLAYPIAGVRLAASREEVAYLCGCHVPPGPVVLELDATSPRPRQVVDSLALTLRCRTREAFYLSALAGTAPSTSETRFSGVVPAHMHRLARRLADYPALVIAPDGAYWLLNAGYRRCTRTSQQSLAAAATFYAGFTPTPTCSR